MRERILAVIEKNSRISVKELADLLGENEAAVAAEIAEMENEHIICGYLMSGGYDFTVMIEAKTMRAVAQFVAEKLSTIDSVLSTATHFILKKYKDHGTVLCDGPQDERMLIVP